MAAKKQMKRSAGRPPGVAAKTRGSTKTRRTIRRLARLLLDESADSTVSEGARRTGLEPHDIKNLRAGNLPSLQLVLRLITRGHFSPNALIYDSELRKLPRQASTRGARRDLIANRIRRLAKEGDAQLLAQSTGLSIFNIYQHRVESKNPGLHTVLGFIDAGAATPNEIFLGRR